MNFSAEKAGWEIAADGLERPRLFLPISRLEEARPDKKTVSTERGQLFLSADAGAICVGSAPMHLREGVLAAGVPTATHSSHGLTFGRPRRGRNALT